MSLKLTIFLDPQIFFHSGEAAECQTFHIQTIQDVISLECTIISNGKLQLSKTPDVRFGIFGKKTGILDVIFTLVLWAKLGCVRV